jgi:hypothetical protein
MISLHYRQPGVADDRLANHNGNTCRPIPGHAAEERLLARQDEITP